MDAATLRAYDADAAAFAQDWHEQPPPADLHDVVRRFFRPGPTADIGSGSGRDVAWLSANGFPAVGYDPSAGLLAQARARYPDLAFHAAALPALEGIADASFANVLCETVIMHLPRQDVGPSVRPAAGDPRTRRHALSELARNPRRGPARRPWPALRRVRRRHRARCARQRRGAARRGGGQRVVGQGDPPAGGAQGGIACFRARHRMDKATVIRSGDGGAPSPACGGGWGGGSLRFHSLRAGGRPAFPLPTLPRARGREPNAAALF